MIVKLRSRIGESVDVDRLLTLAQKYEVLNDSALFLANNLDPVLHLQSLVSTGGVISVDEVGHVPYEVNSISLPSDYLKFYDVYDSTGATTRYNSSHMVDWKMASIYRNPFRKAPADILTCAFDGSSRLFIFNETIPVSVTWRYFHLPVTITDSVETDISDRYHDLLLDYAESLAWVKIDDVARANSALERSMAKIMRLNPQTEKK